MSGFGQTGPYSQRPAYDVIVQGMGGIMSITGYPEGEPVRVGTSIGDITAAMFSAYGILAALIDRDISGEGRMVDVAMLDGQIAILENAISRYAASGQTPKPLGARHPSIAPFGAYKTSDGYILLACGNDSLWEKFCRLVNHVELTAMEEFKTNAERTKHADDLKGFLDEIFSQNSTAYWNEFLNGNGIPGSSINTIDKLFENPQIAARNMLVEVEQPGVGAFKIAGNPIKMSGLQQEIPDEPAPAIGQHTEEILTRYLDYSKEEVAQLREKGIV
jgi:CoA:oxalate CoA-transferase